MKKIVVFSDVHYGVDMLRKMMMQVDDASYYLFLGDGLSGVLDEFKGDMREKLYYVEGNCDTMYTSDKVIEIEGKKILLTHGNKYHVKDSLLSLEYRAEELEVDMVCFGHTHKAYHDKINGIEYLNPGSLGYMCEYAVVVIEKGQIFVIPSTLY